MTIALVTPSPVPFVVGGAEKLFMGMLSAFNKYTGHKFDLIKIPCHDQEFFSLMKCYKNFLNLDLNHFDMVITTKYPAWMIKHPNHHIYMQHPCRGVYDLYEGKTEFLEITKKAPLLKTIENILLSNDYTYENAEILINETLKFEHLNSLFVFPNALTRAVIHFLDRVAILNAANLNAISKTVASRDGYFPEFPVKIIYHPTSLENLETKDYSYIFTASRLEDLKRIDLLIKAYKKVKTDIPFLIAGSGGAEEKLKNLAKDDKRIKFLGFITDEELKDYYANALFVPFVPYNEDYGLITIEAMNCAKAVLTANDSGGVNEFVTHNCNGKVVSPDENEIASAMQELVNDKAKILEMGKNAKKTISGITWQNLINRLLNASADDNFYFPYYKDHKIVVLSTFPIYPNVSGGQNRIYYLHKYISQLLKKPVHIVSLTSSDKTINTKKIADYLYETQIPKTKLFEQRENISEIPVTDIMFDELIDLVPMYKNMLFALNPEIVFVEHPYTVNLAKQLKAKIIHSSHNVEYLLKKAMINDEKLLKKVYELEKTALEVSDVIYAVSQEDAENLKKIYSINKNIDIIPNGVDLNSIPFTTPDEKNKLKKSLNIDSKIALFMGSYHKPNIEAVEEIIKFAKKTPDINYIIIGSVKDAFKHVNLPNVAFTGIISDSEKNKFLKIADIALNPMLSGSGSNLKIIEYLAAGIPTVSTALGSRGFEDIEKYVCIKDIKDFPSAFNSLNYDSYALRKYAEKYDFKKLAGGIVAKLDRQ